jgi:hypothetical protein
MTPANSSISGSTRPEIGSPDNNNDSLKKYQLDQESEDYILLGLRAPEWIISKKAWLLYPNDNFKIYWDILMAIILLQTCFTTPLQFAFQDEIESFGWFMLFNYSMDILFFVDIIINFNSAYQNEVYEMVDDRKSIAKHYMLSWFIIDLGSIVPLDLIIILMHLSKYKEY